MSKLTVSGDRPQRISKALIRQHLEDSGVEDSGESDTTGSELLHCDRTIPTWAPAGDLLSCKSWLDQLCDEERNRFDETSDNAGDRLVGSSNDVTCEESGMQERGDGEGAGCPAINTEILKRIREGCGPRDKVHEDLLAIFRGGSLRTEGVETYEDMKTVLLSWNERVSLELGEDEDARAMLEVAIEKRGKLLKNNNQGLQRSQYLEKSSKELLQALTALRPEIAGFQNQNSLDILTTMWANVRVAVPDLDEELRLLTMKALLDEVESKAHMKNAEKLSGLARSLSVARLQCDPAEVKRLESKMQAFERKLRDSVVKKVIDKIKTSRKELAQVKLKELQELTELQAAQKWAANASLREFQHIQNQTAACHQAEGKLQRVLQQQVPELDAHVQVVSNNANGLARMSASLLSRAKKAGFSLDDQDSPAVVEPAEADVTYISGAVADILDTQAEAVRMLDRMGVVESHLDALLDAAKSQYRAYDGVLQVLEEAEALSLSDAKETEFAEQFGPRRESILLMARNMQRTRHG
ncbi:hypothetical protein OPT61_g2687 [Boeremia exigua]|uniref:Uncharacterized protein n=1 Tax=Boeremia exigua TaxID=749465 RepID=A0ACC2IKM9_9PLEO|nr:hypothetical protein OPT61_g2687 [Boeremia exigua]